MWKNVLCVYTLGVCTISLRWLKARFRRLGLSRRQADPPDDVLRAIIRVGSCVNCDKNVHL